MLGYHYAHIIADAIYMIQADLTDSDRNISALTSSINKSDSHIHVHVQYMYKQRLDNYGLSVKMYVYVCDVM